MDEYKRHQGHDVQWECNEGGLFRLFCNTCKTLVNIFTYIPLTMLRWIFGRDNG